MQLGQIESRRILIVEDEMLIAMNMEDMLANLGHTVVYVATRLPQELAIADSSEIDLAILDLNLSGSLSFPVADVLRKRGTPFMFATGYGANGITEGYRNEIALTKPYSVLDLENAISRIVAVAAKQG